MMALVLILISFVVIAFVCWLIWQESEDFNGVNVNDK